MHRPGLGRLGSPYAVSVVCSRFISNRQNHDEYICIYTKRLYNRNARACAHKLTYLHKNSHVFPVYEIEKKAKVASLAALTRYIYMHKYTIQSYEGMFRAGYTAFETLFGVCVVVFSVFFGWPPVKVADCVRFAPKRNGRFGYGRHTD